MAPFGRTRSRFACCCASVSRVGTSGPRLAGTGATAERVEEVSLDEGQGVLALLAPLRGLAAAGYGPRMFTARAATSKTVTAESADSRPIIAFARRDNGIVSVGLNAIAFVNET
jgi:hypothetical protein